LFFVLCSHQKIFVHTTKKMQTKIPDSLLGLILLHATDIEVARCSQVSKTLHKRLAGREISTAMQRFWMNRLQMLLVADAEETASAVPRSIALDADPSTQIPVTNNDNGLKLPSEQTAWNKQTWNRWCEYRYRLWIPCWMSIAPFPDSNLLMQPDGAAREVTWSSSDQRFLVSPFETPVHYEKCSTKRRWQYYNEQLHREVFSVDACHRTCKQVFVSLRSLQHHPWLTCGDFANVCYNVPEQEQQMERKNSKPAMKVYEVMEEPGGAIDTRNHGLGIARVSLWNVHVAPNTHECHVCHTAFTDNLIWQNDKVVACYRVEAQCSLPRMFYRYVRLFCAACLVNKQKQAGGNNKMLWSETIDGVEFVITSCFLESSQDLCDFELKKLRQQKQIHMQSFLELCSIPVRPLVETTMIPLQSARIGCGGSECLRDNYAHIGTPIVQSTDDRCYCPGPNSVTDVFFTKAQSKTWCPCVPHKCLNYQVCCNVERRDRLRINDGYCSACTNNRMTFRCSPPLTGEKTTVCVDCKTSPGQVVLRSAPPCSHWRCITCFQHLFREQRNANRYGRVICLLCLLPILQHPAYTRP